ncbi:MAG: hypothetical protein A2Y07_02655 [Planctomycetes bacterium GWF2_50_10]|nr:MAG: hypothetical protein A2Y07_02655 [Planctomycetes bacterium GWF2_50_10]
MIYDRIENSGLYETCSGRLKKGLEFIKNFDPATPDGRVEIAGNDVYALVMSYETRDPNTALFEAHKKYIDIQYIVSGAERCDVVMLSDMLVVDKPYDEEKDCALYKAPAHFAGCVMSAGCFAVFYPQDAHRPNCHLTSINNIRKIVVKVKI